MAPSLTVSFPARSIPRAPHGALSRISKRKIAKLEEALGLAALPLAAFVEPMELEAITAADDNPFFRKLAAARNLPEFVKKGLPPLFGRRVLLPPSAEFLLDSSEPLPPQLLETQDLKSVTRISGELRLEIEGGSSSRPCCCSRNIMCICPSNAPCMRWIPSNGSGS
jgi:hypothetical protein